MNHTIYLESDSEVRSILLMEILNRPVRVSVAD